MSTDTGMPPTDVQDDGSGDSTEKTVFCSHCGAENPGKRAACLMCFSFIKESGTGLSCPSCGHENDKEANYCQACGHPLSADAQRLPTTQETIDQLIESGAVVVAAGFAAADDEGLGYEEAEGFDLDEMASMEPAEEAEFAEELPGGEEDMSSVELDALGMPPSALDLAPEAPPAAAPEPVAEEEDLDADFALPGLPPDDDFLGEDAAPPPPPPGAEEIEDFDLAPPPPPPVEEAPAEAPAAKPAPAREEHEATEAEKAGIIDPLAQASEEAEDEDFGDWSLDFPAQEADDEEGKSE